MSNYKVKVNNEAESKEVQGLFEQLGGKHHDTDLSRVGLVVLANNIIYVDFLNHDSYYTNTYKCKELTIPQLKDLVVLKRNDVFDKTHYCYTTNSDYFVSSDNVVYFFNDEKNNTWQKSNYDLSELKPIIKPLKEYLVPQDNGKYALTKATEKRASDWVEVPDGMNFAHKDEFNIHFTKLEMGYRDSIIVWQRHTQPEELPFVDDESKSLNDTYAEIEQVRQTLNERQSTYGDFKCVANTTGQLMAVILNSKNGQTLPYAHEEALHMICSKIARIMNGDMNHKDSWRDIAGYATLIDELL